MKYLHQMSVIILFSYLGEILAKAIPIAIPASVWGLLLLFAALLLKIVKIEHIKECGTWLITILPILFVAPTVNLIDQVDALKNHVVPILIIIFVSTFLTFVVAGKITQLITKGKE